MMLSIHEPLSDELCLGAIVVELLQGFHLPISDYLIDPYGGGALLAATWTAPFFLLLGKTFFVLKLAPFCWHLLSLIAWYFVWREHFSERQTFFILLVFAVSPPQITEFSLYNNGYHFEMILWMALSIILFRKILENTGPASRLGPSPQKGAPRTPSRLSPLFSNIFLLGLLGGFSSMLALTNLVTVAIIWIYLALLKDISIKKRTFYGIYCVGLLIGFSPWLFHNWNVTWDGVKMLVYFFSPQNPIVHTAKDFLKLFVKPHAGLQGLFEVRGWSLPVSRLLTIILMSIYCLSLFLLLRRKWPIWKVPGTFGPKGARHLQGFDIETFGLLFQLLLIILVVVEREGVTLYYYLFPMIPFLGMNLVVLRKPLFVLWMGISLAGNYKWIPWADFGRSLSLRGYSYGQLCSSLETTVSWDADRFGQRYSKLLEGSPLETKKICYANLHSGFFYTEDLQRLEKKRHFIDRVEPEIQQILFENLGEELGRYADYNPEALKSLLKQLTIDDGFYTAIYYGVVRGLNWGKNTLSEMIGSALPICEAVPTDIKPNCYKGLGTLEDTGHEVTKMAYHPVLLQKLPAKAQPFYLMGLGQYFTYQFIYEPQKAKAIIAMLQPAMRPWFYQGLEEGIHFQEDPFVRKEALNRLASWRSGE